MLFGLAIGLTVALAIYIRDRQAVPRVAAEPVRSASVVEDAREEPAPAPAERKRAKPDYEFYEMLPRFEVIVPENDYEVRAESPRQQLTQPGIYELQTGSFAQHGDADRMRAQLALLGIESRIQRVSIDDKTFHRVRIGPLTELERLNDLRARLTDAKIDALTIRVGE